MPYPHSRSNSTSNLFRDYPLIQSILVIYIPLVAIARSHIYFKHQTFLLERKRLDKEVESIKVNKEKEVELQNIKAGTAVAVEKINAANPLDTGKVQGEVGVIIRYRFIPGG
ncbi:hypothetical protein L211DRAFT_832810 [Terfezia boudieri ATCC MYA-4762]|uniref:Uncharacterized protein n=1 Tax=Terfezia boudieri ATCC MYA-4762 TaxID=1051890 RepID=A0A3N4M182_9PEZI|nr:hypothetical protein L211DRAFT_832810 [Terfezia boudieri ATCC MYA-4762]